MTESWDLHEGDEIAPGLTAMRLLGGGSSYEAYLAFDDVLYSPVVVKVVRPHRVADESSLRGLRREVEILRGLNHPVIVRGFHAELEGDRPLVVLEHLDGPRLSTLIRRHGALPIQQLGPLALELCSAAHYLRNCNLVHLDIKPSNIIMGAPARLIDLSIARFVDEAAQLRDPVGTDGYMAPEQCVPTDQNHPGFAADIWGIGCTLFHAAAGFLPFEHGVQDEAAPAEDRWPQLVEPAHRLPRQLPDVIGKLILPCLEPDPAARPTPAELATGVQALMESLPRPRLSNFRVT